MLKEQVMQPSNQSAAIKELMDSGMLFMVNQQVLNPCGLALGIQFDGLGVPLNLVVLDGRQNAHGLTYNEDDEKVILAARTAARTWSKASKSREKALGYVVQEVPTQ